MAERIWIPHLGGTSLGSRIHTTVRKSQTLGMWSCPWLLSILFCWGQINPKYKSSDYDTKFAWSLFLWKIWRWPPGVTIIVRNVYMDQEAQTHQWLHEEHATLPCQGNLWPLCIDKQEWLRLGLDLCPWEHLCNGTSSFHGMPTRNCSACQKLFSFPSWFFPSLPKYFCGNLFAID